MSSRNKLPALSSCLNKINFNLFVVIFVLQLLINDVISECACKKNRDLNSEPPEKEEEMQVPRRDSTLTSGIVDDGIIPGKQLNIDPGEDKSWVFEMTLIPGGEKLIGTNEAVFVSDRESPERKVFLKPFYIDRYEVSNAQFNEFIKETKYVTEAETFGDSFVFQQQLTDAVREANKDVRVVRAEWWYKIKGADWRHPEGPDSSIVGREKFPVIHVSWNDAVAYCKWRNKRLPTEVEWETACRGGKKSKLFPWGNKEMPKNQHWMNIWQGDFPQSNTGDDKYKYLCPVDEFRQNEFDLYNMVGNVWEWTADLWSQKDADAKNPDRVRKGGSYLCHKSYCYRYRCAARSQNTEDSTADNLGFRCAKDIEENIYDRNDDDVAITPDTEPFKIEL